MPSAQETIKGRNVSKSIRIGGRDSTDRHEWDMVIKI